MTTRTQTRPTARKTTRAATKKRAPQHRTLSKAHKAALAEGRTMSATVDRYLSAINAPKKRGRKITTASLVARMAASQDKMKTTTGLERLFAARDVRAAKAKLETQPSTGDIEPLERAFIKIAKKFSAGRKISYGAWRDAGVSAVVLKKAGIARTRDVGI